MQALELLQITIAVLASLGGGSAIVLAFSGWLGNVWARRMLETERARHARELEASKADIAESAADRERKLESLLHQYERQIEEFYGPLFNMVHQIFVANTIQRKLLEARGKDGNTYISAEARETVIDYYLETYFYPLHDEIIKIIRSKLYLIEGHEIPSSFDEYLIHAAQERDQRNLWKHHKIGTSFVIGLPWPERFHSDIEEGFKRAMRNYEHCLEGLKALPTGQTEKTGQTAKWPFPTLGSKPN